MSEPIEVVDRCSSIGMPRPDPLTMCGGQCEGIGCYPQNIDDPGITDDERRRWQAAHDAGEGHEKGECDGYHFIKCPDCNGTGKMPPLSV